MSIIDFIKRRKNVSCQESDDINSAIQLINEFKNRTFVFKGTKKKYFGLSQENLLIKLQEDMDNMLVLYRYTTNIKKYIDKKGVANAEIKLYGKVSGMSRYNPLDIEMEIKTKR